MEAKLRPASGLLHFVTAYDSDSGPRTLPAAA
jgi:catechol 2,3-dioxygenase-like lactoylglutathione lyase family enzyme